MPSEYMANPRKAHEVHELKNKYLRKLIALDELAPVLPPAAMVRTMLRQGYNCKLLTGASLDAVIITLQKLDLLHLPILDVRCTAEMKVARLQQLAGVVDQVLYVDDNEEILRKVKLDNVMTFHYVRDDSSLNTAIDNFLYEF